jgi:hypothetical protein
MFSNKQTPTPFLANCPLLKNIFRVYYKKFCKQKAKEKPPSESGGRGKEEATKN